MSSQQGHGPRIPSWRSWEGGCMRRANSLLTLTVSAPIRKFSVGARMRPWSILLLSSKSSGIDQCDSTASCKLCHFWCLSETFPFTICDHVCWHWLSQGMLCMGESLSEAQRNKWAIGAALLNWYTCFLALNGMIYLFIHWGYYCMASSLSLPHPYRYSFVFLFPFFFLWTSFLSRKIQLYRMSYVYWSKSSPRKVMCSTVLYIIPGVDPCKPPILVIGRSSWWCAPSFRLYSSLVAELIKGDRDIESRLRLVWIPTFRHAPWQWQELIREFDVTVVTIGLKWYVRKARFIFFLFSLEVIGSHPL